MRKLKWNKEVEYKESPVWYSGIYKVVRYEKDSQNSGRPTYLAYYKKPGENFCLGWYVNRQEPYYRTLKAAQSACELHAKTA